jgi:cysteine synthase A
MGRIHKDILSTIGGTPLVKLNRLVNGNATILVKLESKNPCGSVKDRIAAYMIAAAEKDGRLMPGGLIIEPTSGNTGIGLAFIAAAKGYKLILTMPESMTMERRKLLALFGAEIVLTPSQLGMKGAVDKANELVAKTPGAFMPQQFKNDANPQAHRETTAEEILADTDGKVDILVAGVGTGGTITGCGEVLKNRINGFKVIAVEPKDSHVLSGGGPGPHKIQGIGAGFVPDVLDMELVDEIVQVANEDAIQTARNLAIKEGILAGISSGANVWAAVQVANRPENKGKVIVTFICDTGERYISTEMYS